MNNETVHLTFKTDRETSWYLKQIAHLTGITQPELINDICKDFIKAVKEQAEKISEDNNPTI